VSGRDDWEQGGTSRGRPFGVRPFGVRPFGVRPFGVRPFGVRPYEDELDDERPFGVRPFGVRPFGVRPFGVRPFGVRPFGVRPFGVRPFGVRPFGVRSGSDDGVVDLDEWSAVIAELVCEYSAVIRLGATVVSDDYELRVPAVDATPGAPKYLKQTETDDDPAEEKPRLKGRELRLRPRDHELAAKVVLPDRLARDIYRDDVLAFAVKEDLAEALALRADQAFLHGAVQPAPQPTGISNLVAGIPGGSDLLQTARDLVTEIRTVDPVLNPVFRAPGWVLHPETLDLLAQTLVTLPASSLTPPATVDMVRNLLTVEADGGELLGYPYVVSAAAYDDQDKVARIYFSADWREAWIGVGGALVDIDISADVHFQTDEIVIRATMSHDFLLRSPRAFTWAPKDTKKAPWSQPSTASGAASRSKKSSGG
jgi:HK97 family phage major capsid protein